MSLRTTLLLATLLQRLTPRRSIRTQPMLRRLATSLLTIRIPATLRRPALSLLTTRQKVRRTRLLRATRQRLQLVHLVALATQLPRLLLLVPLEGLVTPRQQRLQRARLELLRLRTPRLTIRVVELHMQRLRASQLRTIRVVELHAQLLLITLRHLLLAPRVVRAELRLRVTTLVGQLVRPERLQLVSRLLLGLVTALVNRQLLATRLLMGLVTELHMQRLRATPPRLIQLLVAVLHMQLLLATRRPSTHREHLKRGHHRLGGTSTPITA